MPKSQVDIDDLTPDAEPKDKPKGKSSSSRRRSTATADRELRGRLAECLDRISASLEQRGDEELSEIVREDAQVIAQGLVSLTRPFTALRTVVLAVVAVIEPALAFGRIARVLAGRWADRRAAAQYAQQEQELATQQ